MPYCECMQVKKPTMPADLQIQAARADTFRLRKMRCRVFVPWHRDHARTHTHTHTHTHSHTSISPDLPPDGASKSCRFQACVSGSIAVVARAGRQQLWRLRHGKNGGHGEGEH